MNHPNQTDHPLQDEVTRLMESLHQTLSGDWVAWQHEWDQALPEKERGRCRLARIIEDCAVIEVDSSLRRYRHWLMRNKHLKWLQQRNPRHQKNRFHHQTVVATMRQEGSRVHS
ncbi:MAG: hypothetical protein KatS3mg104_3255 [Phycisphaerae bacterium]|nr:MAG: hypothetical protein KatS3mg104_3255 [Phycisphaerae bacterium]